MHLAALQADCIALKELLCPSYWLVSGLQWTGNGSTAEAAIAIAPSLIPRRGVSHDASQVLGCADLYASKYAQQVVFFSDLTRMFANAGTSWTELGVDWESALEELRTGPYPALLLTVSEQAHCLICSPAGHLVWLGSLSSIAAAYDERDEARLR